MSLRGKNIILAVTGSIAAYKTPQLVRLLVKAGANVQVALTGEAARFVSPLALATVSRQPVLKQISEGDQWHNHVLLGRHADAVLVAPCSANTLAKMQAGICDNIVLALYLSAPAPVFIAPAMDEDMLLHPATQENIEALKRRGHYFIPPGHGELASGIVGEGRMAEPESIVDFLTYHLSEAAPGPMPDLNGKRALVTAGPTYENIDPVRFIGNRSSGKMGIALARALAACGARVDLVAGPVSVPLPDHPRIKVHKVQTAEEMFEASKAIFPHTDIAILAAAVGDFKMARAVSEKIKKGDSEELILTLVKNPDILAHLATLKKPSQLLVGFALETENELDNARKKLHTKKADLIVLNSLKDAGAGFGHDTNKVRLLFAGGQEVELPLGDKDTVSKKIVACIFADKPRSCTAE